MSNALAIATVTQTLVQILTPLVNSSGVGGASVTALRPDCGPQLPTAGVNVFLYQISPNAYLRNADLPTRKHGGEPLRRPQAAVDLYYLFTFYGDDRCLEQQRLLGFVVRQLHAFPALAHDQILAAQGSSFLNGANLADQIEIIRFSPVNYSLEELSKLWSVFLKTDYVLSVAYMASVVLIETDDPPPGSALPVLKWRVKAVPFSLTVINSIEPQFVDPASPPTQITLVGQSLDPADVITFSTPGNPDPISGIVVSATPDGSQMIVQLPDGLRPGVNTVTLTRYAAVSSPLGASGRVIAQSNAAPFILRPDIVSIQVVGDNIEVLISPGVGLSQQVSLLLNPINASPAGSATAYELAGVPDSTQTGVFDFATTFYPPGSVTSPAGISEPISVPAGTYLVRVRVDTAESSLQMTTGYFSGPTVTLS